MTYLMRDFFYTLPRNILQSVWGRNMLWHVLAVGITVLIVSSGFDWLYYEETRPFASHLLGQ